MNGNFHNIVLSFGGNEVNTFSCFEEALHLLKEKLGNLVLISKVYESEAWGFDKPTNPFLNQVLLISSETKPPDALNITQNIEKKLGRKTKSINKTYSDRPIDIDILFFDSEIINSEKLTIPHYLITKRKFILKPLAEILPNFIHPVLKKSVKELLLQCEDKLTVNLYNKKQ